MNKYNKIFIQNVFWKAAIIALSSVRIVKHILLDLLGHIYTLSPVLKIDQLVKGQQRYVGQSELEHLTWEKKPWEQGLASLRQGRLQRDSEKTPCLQRADEKM